jgi:CRP-like cAMP-binding protein
MNESQHTNRLLGALPQAEYDRVKSYLAKATLPLGMVLHDAFSPVTELYFPVDAVVSLIYTGTAGDSTEVAVVGSEGVIGVPAYLGGMYFPSRAVVQAEGDAWMLHARIAVREFNHGTAFRGRLLLFVQALLTQMAQTAVCNRHHTIEQQLCRWLLLSCDRTGSNTLRMTQELIANMLGVRRVGITEAARKLHSKGYIDYQRGLITLTDRAGLEAHSCECYRVITEEYRRLLARQL